MFGEIAVGKTSLMNCFLDNINQRENPHRPTLTQDTKCKNVDIKGNNVKISINDVAGNFNVKQLVQ